MKRLAIYKKDYLAEGIDNDAFENLSESTRIKRGKQDTTKNPVLESRLICGLKLPKCNFLMDIYTCVRIKVCKNNV